jgi:glycosyltransferase
MNILFITHHYLDGHGGGTYASKAYINAFAHIYQNITLLYPDNGKEIQFDYNINAIPIPYNVSIWKKFFHLLNGKIHRYFIIFECILQKEHYDIVVFDNSKTSYRLIDIAHKYNCKVITIHHNFEYEYNRDNSNILLKRLILYWTRKYESEALLKSDLNLTLTLQDKNLLCQYYTKQKVIPIAVLGCFEYPQKEEENKNYILLKEKISKEKSPMFIITGNLNSKQTENSLLPWINVYFPSLKEICPNANLIIAGKKPSKKLIRKCEENKIVIISSPISMKPILEKGNIYICPTKLGGGLKLRIMDGLKTGLIVVSHQISARGYDNFITDKLLFPYNDINSFKIAISEALQTSIVTNKIENIKKYKSLFSFESGYNRLKSILIKNKLLCI